MPRRARLRIEQGEAFYHLYCKAACYMDEMPFEKRGAKEKFIEVVRHFAEVYCCRVYAFCVMGNHYHLVMGFDEKRELARKDLERRAKAFYPSERSAEWIADGWGADQWERLSRRVFDVSELMRNVHQAYAHWYNKTFDRRGRFWAERFKSTILEDGRAVEDCMMYVELNPIRAGLVERPEAYTASSFRLRCLKLDVWLAPLQKVMGAPAKEALLRYRELVYHRGAVPSKEGQSAIREDVLATEAARGFAESGVFLNRIRHFTRGLVVGSELRIKEWLADFRERSLYRRRVNPIPLPSGGLASLR